MYKEVKNKDFRKVLEKLGLKELRIKGDHIMYGKKGLPRPIVFRIKGNIPEFHISTNCRTLGISKEEFFKLLDEV